MGTLCREGGILLRIYVDSRPEAYTVVLPSLCRFCDALYLYDVCTVLQCRSIADMRVGGYIWSLPCRIDSQSLYSECVSVDEPPGVYWQRIVYTVFPDRSGHVDRHHCFVPWFRHLVGSVLHGVLRHSHQGNSCIFVMSDIQVSVAQRTHDVWSYRGSCCGWYRHDNDWYADEIA